MSKSGTTELPVGTLGAVVPTRWYPVASVGSEGEARPRTVRCRVSKQSYIDPLYSSGLPAGVWWAPDDSFTPWRGALYLGAIRFSYGYQGMLRRLYCDLRSGEYQIPPCEFLTVEATRYTPATDTEGEFAFTVDRSSMEIEGEIADGFAADFSPMMFTAPSQWLQDPMVDSGEQMKIAAPPGAYAFEVYPRSAITDPGSRVESVRPGAVRDFGGGVWLPPSSPLPMIDDSVTLRTIEGIARPVDLVFFVR